MKTIKCEFTGEALRIKHIILFFFILMPTIIFGFYPEPLLDTMDISVNGIIQNHQNELTVNLINK